MVELIWGILNIFVFCYVIIIIFRATKIVREKMGFFSLLILFFGLFSFTNIPNEESNKVKIFELQNENKEVQIKQIAKNNFIKVQKIEENLCNGYLMYINYERNGIGENENKLVSATIYRSGVECGTKFRPNNVILNKIEKNLYDFEISGTVDWSIGGIKFYTELKNMKGKVEIN